MPTDYEMSLPAYQKGAERAHWKIWLMPGWMRQTILTGDADEQQIKWERETFTKDSM